MNKDPLPASPCMPALADGAVRENWTVTNEGSRFNDAAELRLGFIGDARSSVHVCDLGGLL